MIAKRLDIILIVVHDLDAVDSARRTILTPEQRLRLDSLDRETRIMFKRRQERSSSRPRSRRPPGRRGHRT